MRYLVGTIVISIFCVICCIISCVLGAVNRAFEKIFSQRDYDESHSIFQNNSIQVSAFEYRKMSARNTPLSTYDFMKKVSIIVAETQTLRVGTQTATTTNRQTITGCLYFNRDDIKRCAFSGEGGFVSYEYVQLSGTYEVYVNLDKPGNSKESALEYLQEVRGRHAHRDASVYRYAAPKLIIGILAGIVGLLAFGLTIGTGILAWMTFSYSLD